MSIEELMKKYKAGGPKTPIVRMETEDDSDDSSKCRQIITK